MDCDGIHMMKNAIWAAGLSAAAMMLAGCGPNLPASEHLAYTKDGPSTEQYSSAVGGELMWDGTCAYFKTASPEAKRSLAVFTKGTATVEDGKIKYGDATYQDGDTLEAGGETKAVEDPQQLTEWADVPATCSDFGTASLIYPAD